MDGNTHKELESIGIKEIQKTIENNPSVSQYLPVIISSKEISLKSKTIMLMVMSHPNIFTDPKTDKENFLLQNCKEGPDAVKSGIKELQNMGLLVKNIQRNEGDGRKYIIGSCWYITPRE